MRTVDGDRTEPRDKPEAHYHRHIYVCRRCKKQHTIRELVIGSKYFDCRRRRGVYCVDWVYIEECHLCGANEILVGQYPEWLHG